MAIYETCIPQRSTPSQSSSSSTTRSTTGALILKAIMRFLWSGPKQLLLSNSELLLLPTYRAPKSDKVYRSGWNDLSSSPNGSATVTRVSQQWKTTLQAGLSMTVWCMGFIVIAAAALKARSATTSLTQSDSGNSADSTKEVSLSSSRHAELLNKVALLARVVKSFWRKLIVRWLFSQKSQAPDASNSSEKPPRQSSTLVTHRGSCLCGAVQFRFQGPRTLVVVEEPLPSIDPDDALSNQYPKIRVAVKTFVLQPGSEQHLKVFRNPDACIRGVADDVSCSAQTFCSSCGLHVMYALRPDASELFINARCCTSSSISQSDLGGCKKSMAVDRVHDAPLCDTTGNRPHYKHRGHDRSYDALILNDDDEFAHRRRDHDDNDDEIFNVTEASSISQSFTSCFAEDSMSDYGNHHTNDPPDGMTRSHAVTSRFRNSLVAPDIQSPASSLPWQSDMFHVHAHGQTDADSFAGAMTCESSFTTDYYYGRSTPEGATLPTTASTTTLSYCGDDNASFASATTTGAVSVVNDKTHWQLRRFMKKHVDCSNKSPSTLENH